MPKRPGDVRPKPVRWVGSSKEDLRDFPEEVRRRVGGALWDAQLGLKAPYAKPLRGFGGAGVLVHRGVQKIHPIGALVCLKPRKHGVRRQGQMNLLSDPVH